MSETEVQKMLQALKELKGKDNQDMGMYSVLPKRTFERKEKPPYGLKVFKVRPSSLFSCTCCVF